MAPIGYGRMEPHGAIPNGTVMKVLMEVEEELVLERTAHGMMKMELMSKILFVKSLRLYALLYLINIESMQYLDLIYI